MKRHYTLLPAFILAATALAQVPLTTPDVPVTIDFLNTVNGVNNGAFDAQVPSGAETPAAGQLDLDAWNYISDMASATAPQAASNYPGVTPNGNGLGTGGALATGLSAVDINGQRALAIQPTSGHWTAGCLDLRASNNTAGTVDALGVSFSIYVFNDADRSNTVRFFYSISSQTGSFVEVPAAQVTSPAALDAVPDWVEYPIAFTIGGFSLNPGDALYLRWEGDDVSGSGTRDEFAFTHIVLTPHTATGATLAANVTGLAPFAQTVGTPGAAQSFYAYGQNLTDDITVHAPTGYQVSINESSGYATSLDLTPSSGTVAPTLVYVRLNSAVPGNYEGTVQLTSPGAVDGGVHVGGTALAGAYPQLFINELMASNDAYMTDPNGEYDDWFELYNPNPTAIDLAGWYCTDNPTQLAKYQFHPDSTTAIVPAHGWLLVWADSQPEQGDLHTNFSLSGGGEYLALVAPDGVGVVDSITFAAQAPDTSLGRATDGGEPWVTFADPTPGASNNATFIAELQAAAPLHVWPMPAQDVLFTDRVITGLLLNAEGRIVRNVQRTTRIDLSGLAPGLYVLRTLDGVRVPVIHQ